MGVIEQVSRYHEQVRGPLGPLPRVPRLTEQSLPSSSPWAWPTPSSTRASWQRRCWRSSPGWPSSGSCRGPRLRLRQGRRAADPHEPQHPAVPPLGGHGTGLSWSVSAGRLQERFLEQAEVSPRRGRRDPAHHRVEHGEGEARWRPSHAGVLVGGEDPVLTTGPDLRDIATSAVGRRADPGRPAPRAVGVGLVEEVRTELGQAASGSSARNDRSPCRSSPAPGRPCRALGTRRGRTPSTPAPTG